MRGETKRPRRAGLMVAVLALLSTSGCEDEELVGDLHQIFDGTLAFDAKAFHPFTARRAGTADLTLAWTEESAGLVLAVVRGECNDPDYTNECDLIDNTDPFPPPGTGQIAELSVPVEGGERYTIVVDYFTSLGDGGDPPELPTPYGVTLDIR